MSNIDKINVNGTEYGVEGVAGDSKDDTTTFTSSDVTDGNATSWTSVNVLASGEKHSSIFAKVSQMFKNVRYLYKTLTALNTNKLQIVECSTARSTAAKTVTLANFTLETGAHIFVRFTNTGSSNPSSGNLTLKVGSSDAKTIVDGHTNKTVMTYANAGYFYNNYVAEFVYDGTYWVWLNRDTNTTYTGASLKTNAAKTGSGTTITNTVAASTTMDNAIGTLLNNDVALNANKEEKTNLASIDITSGTTNNTGAKINSGTYFHYLGTFVRAKTDIASGATLTLNTNYEVVPVGDELTSLRSSLANKDWTPLGLAVSGNTSQDLPSGWKELLVITASNFDSQNNRNIYSVNIEHSMCSSTSNDFFYSGFYVSSSINGGIQLKMTNKASIRLATAYFNGSDVLSSMKTAIYYKM